jgi:hypothetical protein
MRFHTSGRLPVVFAAALLAGAAVVSLPDETFAGNRVRDHVYADSFGNLIVHSPYGYKRIIVGEGNLAGELQNYTNGGGEEDSYEEPSYEEPAYEQPPYEPQGYYDSESDEPYVEPRYQRRGYYYGGEPGRAYAATRYERQRDYVDNCYRPPVLWKGRSYMYGLPDGVIPVASGYCTSR